MESYLLPEPERFGIEIGKTQITDLTCLLSNRPYCIDRNGCKRWRIDPANFTGVSLGIPSIAIVTTDKFGTIYSFLCKYDLSVIQKIEDFLLQSNKYTKSEMWDDMYYNGEREDCIDVVYCYGDNLSFLLVVDPDCESDCENCTLIWEIDGNKK